MAPTVNTWVQKTDDRLRRLERELHEQREYERQYAQTRYEQRRRADAQIDQKLAEINGRARRESGQCRICGESHGTVIVQRYSGGEHVICPIAYWLRRYVECLHHNRDLSQFMQQHPFEEFISCD